MLVLIIRCISHDTLLIRSVFSSFLGKANSAEGITIIWKSWLPSHTNPISQRECTEKSVQDFWKSKPKRATSVCSQRNQCFWPEKDYNPERPALDLFCPIPRAGLELKGGNHRGKCLSQNKDTVIENIYFMKSQLPWRERKYSFDSGSLGFSSQEWQKEDASASSC